MLTNTQWELVKVPAEIKLEGVTVDIDWTDTTVNGVVIRDEKGNALRIIKGEYSGMRAYVPATVEKYRLKGTVIGVNIDQLFDDQRSAEDRKNEILDLNDKAQLTVEKVKVPA